MSPLVTSAPPTPPDRPPFRRVVVFTGSANR